MNFGRILKGDIYWSPNFNSYFTVDSSGYAYVYNRDTAKLSYLGYRSSGGTDVSYLTSYFEMSDGQFWGFGTRGTWWTYPVIDNSGAADAVLNITDAGDVYVAGGGRTLYAYQTADPYALSFSGSFHASPGDSNDARVLGGDNEIDSDDWTYAQVKYSVTLGASQRSILLTIEYTAREGNSDQTFGDTTLYIKKTISISVSSDDWRTIRSSSLPSGGSYYRWFPGGGLFTPQLFGDAGILRNIRVRFDAEGDNDLSAMDITADYSFNVRMNPG